MPSIYDLGFRLLGGFSFGTLGGTAGVTPAATTAAGSSFSLPATTAASTGLGGFSFGASLTGADNQQKSVRFDVPASSAAQTGASSLSSLLGGSTVAGATPASTSLGGFSLGALGATTTATTSTSFGLSSSGLSFGLNAASTSTTASTGGLFGATSVASTAVPTLQGLGGVTNTCGSTTVGTNKTCDAKAVKELAIPPEIVATVDEFTSAVTSSCPSQSIHQILAKSSNPTARKHVKTQKVVRENIARMSSKPLFRVQDDIKNLRKQLVLVTSGLQRNAIAIDKLKRETAQEIKHAEIAHRTKDTPPGLQYENTAPSDYFQRLANEFEIHMQLYRQQIAELENHLESADRAAVFTPQELSLLLGKLNEGFIALAAQLQVVHEAVKELKESYASYRRNVFGDSSDIFDRRLRTSNVLSSTGGNTMLSGTPPTTVGPTPFASMSNSAAVAMANAINRNQPSTTSGYSLGCRGPTSLGTGAQPSLLGGSLFGQTAPGSGSFGVNNQSTSLFAQSPNTTGLFGGSTAGFGATPTFALAKTPIGSKRGKNA